MIINGSNNLPTKLPLVDNETQVAYSAIWDTQTRLMPAICGLGLVTNFLSLLVFLQPSLRRLSCSVYLAAKAVSDFLFLLTVFVIWLSRMDLQLFHVAGICQIVIFFSYLTAFISIWLTVTLTVENLLCVIRPWYVQRTCNVYSAAVITTIIVVLGISLYQFSLWNNGIRSVLVQSYSRNVTQPNHEPFLNESATRVHSYNTKALSSIQEYNNITNSNSPSLNLSDLSETVCMQLEEFDHFIVATAYIDSILTLLIPLLILAVTNAAIVAIACRTARRHRRLNQHKRQYRLPGAHLTNRGNSSASLETQACRFLFAVSMTTLLFHLPSHAIRLRSMVVTVTSMNALLQRVFETLYYTHYAIGFFLYLIFGINFRKVFFGLVARKG